MSDGHRLDLNYICLNKGSHLTLFTYNNIIQLSHLLFFSFEITNTTKSKNKSKSLNNLTDINWQIIKTLKDKKVSTRILGTFCGAGLSDETSK